MENNRSLNGGQKAMDQESEYSLAQMAKEEQVLGNRVPDVKFILVVLSAKAMVYDLEAMRQKISLSYPDATVFFQNTQGKAIGPESPKQVHLLIDLTGPGQRQGLFYAKKLRKVSKFAVGRNAGFFRKKIYNRVFDEKVDHSNIPTEILQRERFVQKKVLHLAGVALAPMGEATPDRGKTIALELPRMKKMG